MKSEKVKSEKLKVKCEKLRVTSPITAAAAIVFFSRWVQSVHLNSTVLFKLVSSSPGSVHYTVHLYSAVHSTVHLSVHTVLYTYTLLSHLNYNMFTTFVRSFYSQFKTFVQIFVYEFLSEILLKTNMSKTPIQNFLLRSYELWTTLSTISVNSLYSQPLLTFFVQSFCSKLIITIYICSFVHNLCSHLYLRFFIIHFVHTF